MVDCSPKAPHVSLWIFYSSLISRFIIFIVLVFVLFSLRIDSGLFSLMIQRLSTSDVELDLSYGISFFKGYRFLNGLIILFSACLFFHLITDFLRKGRRRLAAAGFSLFLIFLSRMIFENPLLPLIWIIPLAVLFIYRAETFGRGLTPQGPRKILGVNPGFLAPLPFFLEAVAPSLFAALLWPARPKFSLSFFKKVLAAEMAIFATLAGIGLDLPLAFHRHHECLAEGDFYGLQIDLERKRLLACDLGGSLLYVFNLEDIQAAPFKMKIDSKELQEIRINQERQEFYHFGRGRNILLVYDINDLKFKRASPEGIEGKGSAGIAFDNKTKTIVITREDDAVWILDMDSLLPLKKLKAGDRSGAVLFCEPIHSYVLSYFNHYQHLIILSPQGGMRSLKAPKYQAGLNFSTKRNELYVAMPLRKEIFAYDLPSLKLKNRISSLFGVIAVGHDEVNDVLVTGSVCSGIVEARDLARNRILTRQFLGYHLREISLNPLKREAFISSHEGLYWLKY